MSQQNPPTLSDLLDEGFDLQYFNPPAEYPVKLEQDWYLKFVRGPIKVTNPPKPAQKESKRNESHPSKKPNQRPTPTPTPTTTDSNRSQEKEKPPKQKRPTVSEIDDEEIILLPTPTTTPSPTPELNTEIFQQVQHEVAKEILEKHKYEVEQGIQKRVAAHMMNNMPKGYNNLQSVEFDEEEFLDKEQKRRQMEREKAQKAANVHRRRWK